MNLKIPGQQPLPPEPTNGFIMILAVIIISAVISTIVISISLGTVTLLEKSDTVLRGEQTRYYVEGCMQEALLQLSMDTAYAGGILNLGGSTCTVAISGSGNTRTITVEGNNNDYYRQINADVTLKPFSLDLWDY
ncbi:MAG: hypothetical protein ABIH67_02795 [Candidatus Uhrbacteria bacterium]